MGLNEQFEYEGRNYCYRYIERTIHNEATATASMEVIMIGGESLLIRNVREWKMGYEKWIKGLVKLVDKQEQQISKLKETAKRYIKETLVQVSAYMVQGEKMMREAQEMTKQLSDESDL